VSSKKIQSILEEVNPNIKERTTFKKGLQGIAHIYQ